MKKHSQTIIIILVAALLLMGMTGQPYIQTCGKRCITEMTWASGETTAQTETITMHGKCTQIEFDCAENTTNNITFTVAVTTADSGSLFSQASLADNGSTILSALSNKATQDANFNPFLMAEAVTVTVTPSGDPGTTGATVNVGFYLE